MRTEGLFLPCPTAVPEAAVTASRRSVRPRSWWAFSLRHLDGIWMPLRRAFDCGQRKQVDDSYVGDDVTIRDVNTSDK